MSKYKVDLYYSEVQLFLMQGLQNVSLALATEGNTYAPQTTPGTARMTWAHQTEPKLVRFFGSLADILASDEIEIYVKVEIISSIISTQSVSSTETDLMCEFLNKPKYKNFGGPQFLGNWVGKTFTNADGDVRTYRAEDFAAHTDQLKVQRLSTPQKTVVVCKWGEYYSFWNAEDKNYILRLAGDEELWDNHPSLMPPKEIIGACGGDTTHAEKREREREREWLPTRGGTFS